jgi:hypothetical protein
MEAMVNPARGHVGVAISALELCAVRTPASNSRAALWRAPLEPINGDGSNWPSLTAALRDLANSVGGAGGTLSIALMPPLVEVRTLELPPLREDELRSLLTRNAARYFVAARAPQLIGVVSVQGGKRAAGPVVAAAAPARLVSAVHAAARDAGWSVDSVAPAESAWAAGATAIWPVFAQRAAHLIVVQLDRTNLIHLYDGRIAAVRRFRPGAADAARIADAIAETSNREGTSPLNRVGIMGQAEGRKELTRALSSSGLTLTGPQPEFAEIAEQPDRLAAAFAAPRNELTLRTDDVRAEQLAREKRFALGIAAAAAGLLLLCGAFELWGVRRELRVVAEERAALRPQLSVTLVGRTSVETAYRQLATLSAVQRVAPRWSAVLAQLAGHLDTDAYLTAFRGRGDSVVVDGIALHAARVFDDFEQTPGLSGVHAPAPVRHEAPNGADATERFTIAARLSDAATSSVTSQARR